MNIDKKLDLIKQVGEEIVGIDEIKEKLEKLEKGEIKEIRAYDGFEPSGQIHIAQGLLRAIQVNKLTVVIRRWYGGYGDGTMGTMVVRWVRWWYGG